MQNYFVLERLTSLRNLEELGKEHIILSAKNLAEICEVAYYCAKVKWHLMAFNGIRALPLMTFAVCDCLMAGAFLLFNAIRCHSANKVSDCHSLSFNAIEKKSKITLQGFFAYLHSFFLVSST